MKLIRVHRKSRAKRWMSLAEQVPAYKHGSQAEDGEANVDGEPSMIYLRRFDNDRTLRGRIWNSCCDCGLEHLLTFEVIHMQPGWWLIKRAYRSPERSKAKKRRKK